MIDLEPRGPIDGCGRPLCFKFCMSLSIQYTYTTPTMRGKQIRKKKTLRLIDDILRVIKYLSCVHIYVCVFFLGDDITRGFVCAFKYYYLLLYMSLAPGASRSRVMGSMFLVGILTHYPFSTGSSTLTLRALDNLLCGCITELLTYNMGIYVQQ